MTTPAPDEARRRLLLERAQALAAAPAPPPGALVPLIVFAVAGHRHAVLATHVRQVLEASRLSPLGGAPRWLLGAMRARARIVPVLSLRVLLGYEGAGIVDASRVLLLEDGEDLFGVAVDDVEGQIDVPELALSPSPGGGPLAAVAPDHLPVLEVSRLGPRDVAGLAPPTASGSESVDGGETP